MKPNTLAYNEQHEDLHVRITAHKKYASLKTETLIEEFLANKKRARVCDVGCGSGNYTCPLARQADIYVGLDINEALLAKASETAIAESMANVVFMRWDMNRPFPFVAQSFDLVFSGFSAYYVDDASQLVKVFYDLLRPGGALCILGPAPGNAWELDRISEISFEKMATQEREARLDRMKNEFAPLVNQAFSSHSWMEFDISLVFPSVAEYTKYYMATPQYRELVKERGPRSYKTITDAVETIPGLRLSKKVLMLQTEKAQT